MKFLLELLTILIHTLGIRDITGAVAMLTVQGILGALSKWLGRGSGQAYQDYLSRAQDEHEELNIEWLDSGNSVFVYIPVGSLSANQDNELLQELMEENLFHQGVQDNAIFGFDEDLDEVFLFQNFCTDDAQGEHFVSSCVGMIDQAKTLRSRLLMKVAPPSYVGSLARFSNPGR